MRIEKVLRQKKAFNRKTAIDPEEAGINFKGILRDMKNSGAIKETLEGKIYLTGKALRMQRNFEVH